MRRACFDRRHPGDYLDLSADGSLADYSRSAIGFTTTFYFGWDDASGSSFGSNQSYLRLVGGPAVVGGCASAALHMPPQRDGDETLNLGTLKSVWMAMLEEWEANRGSIVRTSYKARFQQPHGFSHAGAWMVYVPDARLVACMPEHIAREPHGAGVVLQCTPHLPDPHSDADYRAGCRMADALEEFGMLKHTYMYTGWPPDPDVERYERYITGAPSGRKYVVNCVDFDGWDPERKVLLYAKLFRQLKEIPKQWGLRGLDEPVINEARRQVRAAAKAGGVPIEWHIGLEEPARRASYLIAEHTDIKEHQLRVFYNPMPRMAGGPGGVR
jgi:hypothetical protein